MYSKDLAPNNEYNLSVSSNTYLESLLDRIRYGDKDALSELYNLTKSAVYSYVLSLLKNKEEAEDVFQDVYIKIYENVELYSSKGKPLSWIFTIAKNESYMKLRKRKNHIDFDIIQEIFVDKKNVSNIDDKIILEVVFNVLSDEERNILVLHVLGGLKHREIAKMLRFPLSTVLSKYNRTLKKLKEVLKEDKNEK